jgi:hypothetical protein
MKPSFKALLGAVVLMCATEHAALAQSPIEKTTVTVRQTILKKAGHVVRRRPGPTDCGFGRNDRRRLPRRVLKPVSHPLNHTPIRIKSSLPVSR